MHAGPLDSETVSAANWPAARLAAEILARLGARPAEHPGGSVLRLGSRSVLSQASTPEEDWVATGLDEVSPRVDGPATLARGLGLAIEALGGPSVDGAICLGARLDELPRPSPRTNDAHSATGDARLLPTRDGGWVALSLSRSSDLELLPALIEHAVGADYWAQVGRWVSSRSASEVLRRGTLLGLPMSLVGENERADPWSLVAIGPAPPRPAPPLVVNLGSLWAAPLAAHLLHLGGARVLDVDTGRQGETSSRWRQELRTGHERVTVDLSSGDGRSRLRALLLEADVVLEASRPRALLQLGLSSESLTTARARAWVRITGHPRPAERVAFGDDAAASAGLVGWDDRGPHFVGDAIADPLTGLTAAVLALACCRGDTRWTADLSLASTAAHAARYPKDVIKSV